MSVGMRGDPTNRRLNTWKEIAGFFGRDERTVKRWETDRGLPVRRLPNGSRSTVYAYERDLAAWLDGGGAREESSTNPNSTQPGTGSPPQRPSPAWRRFVLPVLTAFLLGMGIGLVVRPLIHSSSPAAPSIHAPSPAP
jgi:hypothetical protein